MMDLYEFTLAHLLELAPGAPWPEMEELIRRVAARKPYDWRLPVMACEAVGGSPEMAMPGAAAIACLQISIILVDDMLDADARGAYRRFGMPATANLAIAFQAAGLKAITRGDAALSTKLAAARALNVMALRTAYGQHLDLQTLEDEAAYWRLVRTKSSSFFGAALYTGALLGKASGETAGGLRAFGRLYGEAVQIQDDLNDAMATPANPDWLQGRRPLPILYATVVGHPERDRFLALRGAVADEEALAEAQQILIRSGAVSYCVDQLVGRYRKLRQLLDGMSLARSDGLEDLLDGVATPVRAVLTNTAGDGATGRMPLRGRSIL